MNVARLQLRLCVLAGALVGCGDVVVDEEAVHVYLKSGQVTVAGSAATVQACDDGDKGVRGIGPVMVGLRQVHGGWWDCKDIGGKVETLSELEQALESVSLPLVKPGGQWDVWIIGYLTGPACGVIPREEPGKLCGFSARFSMPPPGNAVSLPLACVPAVSVSAEHKAIEKSVQECVRRVLSE